MLNVGEDTLETMEHLYPGIRKTVKYYESLYLPRCPTCASEDTAKVSAGSIGRSIHVASATTKMHSLNAETERTQRPSFLGCPWGRGKVNVDTMMST
jgi:hypothetical protein